MKTLHTSGCLLFVLALTLNAATIPGDAARGKQIFTEQRCIHCHSVNGEGGTSASDLARRPGEGYSPVLLAAAIWNHAPQMWTAIEAAGIQAPQLTVDESADLFAYFYAFRYFEDAGDAGRGKQVFDSRGCAGCHGQSATGPGGAAPIAQWQTAGDAIQLARAMWNHAPTMREAMGDTGRWPELTAQEMTDLVVYVQNLPGNRGGERSFAPASAETGEMLFAGKGCAGCHIGGNSLEGKLSGRTMAGLAASMWNHAPQMREKAGEIRPEEMTRLVGYLWSIQYFDEEGDAARGAQVIERKGCNTCHGDQGGAAPSFARLGGEMDSISFVSDVWRHGPAMWKLLKESGQDWPRFERNELGDLLAYMNSL